MCPNRSKKRPPIAVMILFFIAVAMVIVTVLSTLVMYLWNTVLAEVVPVKVISFWQAMGILILTRILFGGFRMGSKNRNYYKKEMKRSYQDKWASMDQTEKAKFKEGWEDYCKKKGNNN